MEITGIILVIILFIVGMAGTIYPVLPGVFAIYGAFFVYGFFVTFEHFNVWFWIIQTFILIVLLIADYLVGAWGVKKFGGTRASVIGSTIGILIGPFIFNLPGLIIGPFVGAVIGEMIVHTPLKDAMKVGLGSVVGLFSSVAVKIVMQGIMILLFILWIL